MELHQLRYFVAVAREGTFTRAAARLYISQPSLSEQVRKLELELGSPLFERLGRRLALTSAGVALLPHAERVLDEVEQARLRVREVLGLSRGRLAIGVLPSAAARLLPRFLAEFRHRHPGVELVLREEDLSVGVEDLVHEGVLDLAIIRLPTQRADLDVRLLLREPMVLVAPPGHRLRGRRAVSLPELAEEPFVVMKAGTSLRELVEAICATAGFHPRVALESSQLASVVSLAQAGVGVTIVPEMAAGPDGAGIRISDASAYRELGVIWRQGQPLAPAAQAFLDMLRRSAGGQVRHAHGASPAHRS